MNQQPMQPEENDSAEDQEKQHDASLNRRQVLKTAGWIVPGITAISLVNTASATSNGHWDDGGRGRDGGQGRRRGRGRGRGNGRR